MNEKRKSLTRSESGDVEKGGGIQMGEKQLRNFLRAREVLLEFHGVRTVENEQVLDQKVQSLVAVEGKLLLRSGFLEFWIEDQHAGLQIKHNWK